MAIVDGILSNVPTIFIFCGSCNFSEHYSTYYRIGEFPGIFYHYPGDICRFLKLFTTVCSIKGMSVEVDTPVLLSILNLLNFIRSYPEKQFFREFQAASFFWINSIAVFCYIQWYSKYPSRIMVNPEKITNVFVLG